MRGDATRRIHELARLHGLGEASEPSFAALLELLAGDPLAPTTVRDPSDAVDEHLADSLVALDLPQVTQAREVADLGAGAGFPGLPLAIALAGATVWLVESNGRKCAFIERAAVAAGVGNARVVNARAESWGGGIGKCDLVTARALAAPSIVAEYAAPLLRLGGALVLWRGRRDEAVERDAEAAAAKLGMAIVTIVKVKPFRVAEHRHLYVMSKVAETPSGFPRRPGMAQKHPLRAE